MDTTHALIDTGYSRETLYVSATRAREETHFYVPGTDVLGVDGERPPEPATDALDRIAGIIAAQQADLSATEIARTSELPRTRKHSRRRASSVHEDGPRVTV